MRILPVTPATATYDGKVDAFSDVGQGLASVAECERGRTVKVIHLGTTRFVIGIAETNKKGKWKVTGSRPPTGDTVVAKVVKGAYEDDGHQHSCPSGKETAEAP